MNIIIATSGNGGHLFCGLSIGNAVKGRLKDSNLFFLGSGNKLSRKLVENSGFKFCKVYAAGMLRRRLGFLRFIISQVVNLIQTFFMFLYIRPKVVVSTGGFASIGIVFWGFIFKKPVIIHEQNFIPGKANMLAGYMADKILISFHGTEGYFKEKRCKFTAMPIRFNKRIPQEEARIKLGLDPKKFTVLVMGGSKGAHRINQIIADMLDEIPKDIQFIHLTGTQDLDFIKDVYRKNNLSGFVDSFSTKMDLVYSASSIVIGRAGSGMLAEVSFFRLPSILIPYPYSRDRHQYKNAEYLAQKGAAVVMPEEDISVDKLIELINSRDKLQEMAQFSVNLSNPLASEKIADEIMEYINA